jgi:signal transduction histidine kinase
MGRPQPGDLALAAATAAVTVGGVYAELDGATRPVSVPAFGGYLLAVGAGAAVAWRRRAPLPAATAVALAVLLYHLLGYPGLAPAAAMVVAAHAMTSYSPHRLLLPTAVLIAVVGAVPALPPHPAAWNASALLGPPMVMVAAAAVGDAGRSRELATAERVRAARSAAIDETHRLLVEQRLNIARELHDVLAHTITVISVQAAVGADALAERPDDTRAALAAVRGAARNAMSELRTSLRLLRSGEGSTTVAPPQPGLAQLPQLVEQAGAAGVRVQISCTGEATTVPPAVELAAYRIVQEALTNTIRHSAARAAAVAIRFGSDELTVEVTDDGPPADSAPPSGAVPVGGGLTGMRERAAALGGRVEAGPDAGTSAGSGFRVAARLPIRPGS